MEQSLGLKSNQQISMFTGATWQYVKTIENLLLM